MREKAGVGRDLKARLVVGRVCYRVDQSDRLVDLTAYSSYEIEPIIVVQEFSQGSLLKLISSTKVGQGLA